MPALPLRIRHSGGMKQITVSSEDSIQQLISTIEKETETLSIEIKSGYPPKLLELSDPSAPISSLGLKPNEPLVISAATGNSSVRPKPSPPVKVDAPVLPVAPKSAPPESTPSSFSGPSPKAVGKQGRPTAVALPSGEHLVHRIVPDDNCLIFGGISPSELRQLVAKAIESDSETYSEVFLERPPAQYISTILKETSWGGAIELSIFAKHFRTEISSIDVASGRIDRFGEGMYDDRCILIYSGIHYDALSLSPGEDLPADFHQTVFNVNDDSILKGAKKITDILKAQHYYTDTATFDLRCQVCNVGLKGEKGAREHAKQTGHVEFGEY